jgi:hypothetical protein
MSNYKLRLNLNLVQLKQENLFSPIFLRSFYIEL